MKFISGLVAELTILLAIASPLQSCSWFQATDLEPALDVALAIQAKCQAREQYGEALHVTLRATPGMGAEIVDALDRIRNPIDADVKALTATLIDALLIASDGSITGLAASMQRAADKSAPAIESIQAVFGGGR